MKFRTSLLFSILIWSLLLWRAGYRFGTGDQTEFLSYILYLNDPSLYQNDFFLQGLADKIPNERTVIAYLLLPFINHLEITCFVLQFLFTVVLILGLQKLGYVLTENISATRFAILFNFLLFFDKGLGNVELYNDAFQTSNIGVAFIAFGLYCFFKQHYLRASLLMSIASVFHPVEGLTVFLVMTGVLLTYTFILQTSQPKIFLKSVLLYAVTAGLFIGTLLHGKFDGVSTFSEQFDKEIFYRIFFEFRHPHHYVFEFFPLHEKVLFGLFAAVNLIWGYNSNRQFFWFSVFAVSGIVVFIFCTDYLRIIDIANLQFYKITQWLKFFSILIMVNGAFMFLKKHIKSDITENSVSALSAGGIVIILLLLFLKPDWVERKNVCYQFGAGWKEKNDAVMISRQIDKVIDKKAVFIQPFSYSELKYFGRTSSWVDWKAFMKNRSQIFEWYRRINMVYGISVEDKERGFQLSSKAEEYFFNLDGNTTGQLKQEGVTHILTANKNWQHGELLFENKSYSVYRL